MLTNIHNQRAYFYSPLSLKRFSDKKISLPEPVVGNVFRINRLSYIHFLMARNRAVVIAVPISAGLEQPAAIAPLSTAAAACRQV